MQLVVYVVCILGLAFIEGRPLVKAGKWKEMTIYSALLIAGLGIIIMDSISYHPLRISSLIDPIFRSYWNLVQGFLFRY